MANVKQNTTLALIAITTVAAATGCPAGDKAGKIDHGAVQQALDNTRVLAANISTDLEFLSHSLVVDAAISAASTDDEPCADFACDEPSYLTPPDDDDFEDYDQQVGETIDQLVDEIEARLINDASIEESTARSITYLARGNVMCAEPGSTPDPDCVGSVNALQLRVVATTIDGTVHFDVKVGPERLPLATIRSSEDSLGVDADLAEVKTAVQFIQSMAGDDIELPPRMAGNISATLSAGNGEVSLAASTSGIDIGDEEFSAKMLGAADVLLSANSESKTLDIDIDLPAIDVGFLWESQDYDYETGIETSTSRDVLVHLGGLSLASTLQANYDVVAVTNLGLGDETSHVSVDGEQVVAIDFNANDGRRIEAMVTVSDADTTVEVSPLIDLRVDLNLGVLDDTDDIASWLLDDVLTVKLDGAAKPTVRFADEFGVLAGKLTLALENAGDSVTLDAGQCFVSEEDDWTEVPHPDDEDGSTLPPEEPEEPTGPFDHLEVTTCG